MVVNSEETSSQSSISGVARACLICRPNSHPFNDRNLALDQAVKVGRSVARARATSTNAIFDCKVLSRNHALLWYEAGKFYLQDTKSSNGTFVNNQRLSKGSEESAPREVCSGKCNFEASEANGAQFICIFCNRAYSFNKTENFSVYKHFKK